MILGYAWSNFTVLNLVNVKLTYFPNEPFDLLTQTSHLNKCLCTLKIQ